MAEGSTDSGASRELHSCAVCRQQAALVRVDAETEAYVAANAPGWQAGSPLCGECARRFEEHGRVRLADLYIVSGDNEIKSMLNIELSEQSAGKLSKG